MKIAHILYSGLGGHGNVFFSMVKAAENTGIEFEAIFAGVEEVRPEYIKKCTANNVPWKFVLKKRGLDLNFSGKIIKAIKKSDSSIVFLHGSRFILLAKIGAYLSKNKKKIIVRETQANHLKTRLEWLWLGLAMLLADKIIFLTDSFNKEVAKKLKVLYRSQKACIISNGIDLSFFQPVKKHNSEIIVIGMQSRIVPIKDHSTLLDSMAIFQLKHPDIKWHLKIAGDGESLLAMKVLARQLHIEEKVLFTGILSEVDLVSFLQSLDIYVHASLGETMSTAIMQAMACKLPIIASDVPGINNMIENDKTGILVPAKNASALAEAIYTLISDPDKAAALKAAAFGFADLNYSNKTMFAKYEAVFKSLLII